MKIQGFRVRKYRNIEDSGYVNLVSDLTCIVGKNQSGKTALLRALYKFNPYRADPYDLRREWPRAQRTTRNSKQVVCEVNFKLEEEEQRTLAELTGQALIATDVIVAKDYEGRFEIRFPEQPDFFPDALHASNEAARDYIIERIPTFVYMDDYKCFRGNAHLDTLKQKLTDSKTIPLTEEDETFLMILRLAGLDLDQLVAQGKSRDEDVLHDRQLDLQDAATTLTSNVAGRWGQNNYKIHLRADGQFFFTDIEEIDKRIGMIPLEEQSKGFQWFFSFDLQFMHDSEGTFEGCVLLLDEPGLHLHPGGQADLLKRLDAYSEKNTTIYTTHLPFLVDVREPSRIRVISQVDGSAVVSDDLGASQSDEKLTLQAALGMRANRSCLVANRHLVVGGVDDYWILTELSNILQRSGEKGLPGDVLITAAGGASEVAGVATFMIGQDLQVIALFDSNDAGRREEEKLRTCWLPRYKNSRSATLLLNNALGLPGLELTIEDLFSPDYYFSKVKESHALNLQVIGKDESDLTLAGSGSILPRVERACESAGIAFHRRSAAKLIRKDLLKISTKRDLRTTTPDTARKLFSAIRQTFGEP